MDSQSTIVTLLLRAEQFEQNGTAFYNLASQYTTDPMVCNKLKKLADMETDHEQFFTDIKSKYSAGSGSSMLPDKGDDIVAYIEAIQANKIFNFDLNVKKLFSDDATLEDIMGVAIALEKDSIVFYTGLLNIIPDKTIQEVLNRIIREEISHLAIVSNLPIY